MANNLGFIRRVIYNLKRRFGVPLDLYQNIIGAPNLETGKKNVTRTKYHVQRALVSQMSGFGIAQIFNAAYMKDIGREFAYGATLHRNIVTVAIDARDLPNVKEISPESWQVVYKGDLYNITRADLCEGGTVHSIIMKSVHGSSNEQIVTPNVQQDIRFTQRVEVTVN